MCCVGWEDTFIYHNNKDNSIKTPIIARYNREDRGILCGLFITILTPHHQPDRFAAARGSKHNLRWRLIAAAAALIPSYLLLDISG